MIAYKVSVGDSFNIIVKKESAYAHHVENTRIQNAVQPVFRKPVSIETVIVLSGVEPEEKKEELVTQWIVKGVTNKDWYYEVATPTREKARELKKNHIARNFKDVNIVRRIYKVINEEAVR